MNNLSVSLKLYTISERSRVVFKYLVQEDHHKNQLASLETYLGPTFSKIMSTVSCDIFIKA